MIVLHSLCCYVQNCCLQRSGLAAGLSPQLALPTPWDQPRVMQSPRVPLLQPPAQAALQIGTRRGTAGDINGI